MKLLTHSPQLASSPATYQGKLGILTNLQVSLEAGNKLLPCELETALDTYEVLVNKWHDVITFDGFALEDAIRYIRDENLIQQELGELVQAMETYDYPEVLDAILDIYWELIPVVKFLNNFKDLMLEVKDSPFAGDVGENFAGDMLNNLRYLSGDYKEFRTYKLLALLIAAHGTCRHLLLTIFTPETMVRSLKEVVVSNFSKFIPVPEVGSVDYSLTEEVEDVIMATERKYKEQVLDNLTKVGDDVFLVLRNGSGKVLKPKGLFIEPKLVLNSTDIARIENAIDRSK